MSALKQQADLQALLDLMRTDLSPRGLPLYAKEAFSIPDSIILGDLETGMVMLFHEGAREYECHYIFPPWVRGKALVKQCRAFLETVFLSHGAKALHGYVPYTHPHSRVMTRMLGFNYVKETTNLAGDPCRLYRLTYEDWLKQRETTPISENEAPPSSAQCDAPGKIET